MAAFKGYQVWSQVGPQDVLCGRDRSAFNHTGNRHFRIKVELQLERYVAAKFREEKSHIIMEIIQSVESAGGRFLKWQNDRYVELSDHAKKQKVGHAYRDMGISRGMIKAPCNSPPGKSPAGAAKPPRRILKAATSQKKQRAVSVGPSILSEATSSPLLSATNARMEGSISHSSESSDNMPMSSPLRDLIEPTPLNFAWEQVIKVSPFPPMPTTTLTRCHSEPSSPKLSGLLGSCDSPSFSLYVSTSLGDLSDALSDSDHYNIQLDSESSAFEDLLESGLDLGLFASIC